jgi:hypothetical protein
MALEDCIVRIAASPNGPAVGTGFFASADGWLFTCNHVVEMCGGEAWARWKGQSFSVYAVVNDEWRAAELDFALLKVGLPQTNSIQTPPFGNTWKPGERIQTAGYQYEDQGFSIFAATGILGGPAERTGHNYLTLEQATNVQQGISGAPAFSIGSNRIIGVITEKNDTTDTALIIPFSEIASFLTSVDDPLGQLRSLVTRMTDKTATAAINSQEGLTLYYSYAAADEKLQQKLETALALLRRQGDIQDWHKRKITAGQDRIQEVDAHLNAAKIILLLVSADFLASDDLYEVEMTRAMERHVSGEARVIPIILRPCDWQAAPFGSLQELPRDGKAISEWSSRNAAFTETAKEIRQVISSLRSSHSSDAQLAE